MPCHKQQSLANGVGKIKDGGGDVGAEGVGQVRCQALDGALASGKRLHGKADESNHRKAAVLDCMGAHIVSTLV